MDDLSAWFRERPQWLQAAAQRLLDKGSLIESDIQELVSLCRQEAEGAAGMGKQSFPSDAFIPSSTAVLKLSSIADVKAINALAPRSPLDFGEKNLSVVYGLNGSGKSGYVRILKHACGARQPGSLHPNVYTDESIPQQCEIKYEQAGSQKTHQWIVTDGVLTDLRPVDIYDTACGLVYLEKENEVTYEPAALAFFSDLVDICEQVTSKLEKLEAQIPKRTPDLPSEYANTEAGKWYSQIAAETTNEDLAKYCAWEKNDDSNLQKLEKRLSEATPDEKAKRLRAQSQQLDRLSKNLEAHLEILSDNNCRAILELKEAASLKRKTANIAATHALSDVPLDGAGSPIWKLMWQYAQQYSESQAYKGIAFPNTGDDARCVLCQQNLSEDAITRFKSFDEFIKGKAEQEATLAEKSYQDAIDDVEELPKANFIETAIAAAGIIEENEKPTLKEIYDVLRARKDQLPKGKKASELTQIPDCTAWLQSAKTQSEEYIKAAKEYQSDASNGNVRSDLQATRSELKSRKWLHEQKKAIEAEMKRLKVAEKLQTAKKLADTRGLSRKKGDLADTLITDAFVERFQNELNLMGAKRVKVELARTHVERGKVLHEIRLKDAHRGTANEVLSEGEHRVVSLAAFLADVTGKASSAPFVFDDPISSLDQEYEEAVVQRLVELSKGRQVIVFTHRLSLLALIKEYSEKVDQPLDVTCVREESWGTGEPGDTPLIAKRPDKALNMLINDRMPKANRLYEEQGHESYTPMAKSICSDFRIILERMIEWQLLADVVQRFRRSVITKGKIEELHKITENDCKLFDDLMTKYSRYEHSQPIEAPVDLPNPDELNTDLTRLKSWYEEFHLR